MKVADDTLLEHVLGEIRAELARRRLPQRKLAEVLEISEAQVSERLSGRVALDIPELAAISRFLDLPIAHFLPVAERAG